MLEDWLRGEVIEIPEFCPKCGSYTVDHDPRSELKKCYLTSCDYKENYCRERWNIEHDMLWKLAGVKENTMKCYRPRGLRMCDDCDLRATYPVGWNKKDE